MKKSIPYIIAAVVAALLLWLFLPGRKARHHFDQRVTLRKADKIPYGSYIAYDQLPTLFPSAAIDINRVAPDAWKDSISDQDKQALLVVTPLLFADESEMKALIDFAKKGNDVFISTRDLSLSAQNYLHCEISGTNFGDQASSLDTLEVKLNLPLNEQPSTFKYPGKRFDSYFFKYDSAISYEYGSSKNKNDEVEFDLANFIRLKTGAGNIYLHLAPVCFSNYFLLHHSNFDYYNQALSVIAPDRKKILWDEYYLYKYAEYNSGNNRSSSSGKRDDGDILSGLMSNPSFRAALWLLVAILAILALQEIRRKQRLIPELPPPRNDSMEFVKTIGRLYYEKRDNKNLSRKMTSYFLEHVRSRYKLSTVNLDEKFTKNLQMKSGQPEENIQAIVSFIGESDQMDPVSDKQLAGFHKQLEEFYKHA